MTPICISPSQLKAWRCPRQWAFSKLFKESGTITPGLIQGRALDERVTTGRPAAIPDEKVEAQFRALAPYLPVGADRQYSPPPATLLEGVELGGKLDLYVAGPPAIVLDTKTTAGTRREAVANGWVLNETTMLEDYQVMSYAWLILQARPELSEVACRWLYVSRRMPKPEAWPVSVVVRRDMADEWIERVARPIARAMAALRAAAPATPLDVPHNPEHCGYGNARRCSYAGQCPVMKGPLV